MTIERDGADICMHPPAGFICDHVGFVGALRLLLWCVTILTAACFACLTAVQRETPQALQTLVSCWPHLLPWWA
jgi:hypothetical protein